MERPTTRQRATAALPGLVIAQRQPAEASSEHQSTAALRDAGINGGSFLSYSKDYSSLIMAGLFAVSLAAYLGGRYVSES